MANLGELTVVSPGFIATLAVLAVGGWTLWHRAGRHGRARGASLRRAVLLGVATVLTLATAASGVNSYFSYLPKVADLVDVVSAPRLANLAALPRRTYPAGRLGFVRIPDLGSGFGRSSAMVWLPPQYFTEPRTRFEVVYLFHGSPGVAKDWFRGGEAASTGLALAHEGRPVILVSPRMSRGWLDDPECVDGVHEHIESHLVRDVIPTIDRTLRTQPVRTGRIFAGMSAGGFCALNMGLRHRQLTATVLDFSGLTMPTRSGGMVALFGDRPAAQVAANSPDVYAASLSRLPSMRIWLDAGRSDSSVLDGLRRIAPVLRSRGWTVRLETRPGDHTYSVWRPALRQSLEWALGTGNRL